MNPFMKLHYCQTSTEKLAYRYIFTSESLPTLYLIHGNMCSSFIWFTLIDRLHLKYNILCPDLRGFGHSSYNKPINAIEDYCIDLYELLNFLKIKSVILIGLSLGGTVGMKFSIKFPEIVKGLILFGSVGIKGYYFKGVDEKGVVIDEKMKDKEALEKLPPVAIYLMCLQTKNQEFIHILFEKFLFNVGKTISDENFDKMVEEALMQKNYIDTLWALNNFNVSDNFNEITEGNNEISKIGCPTLIIHGNKDKVIPLKESIATFHAIKAKIKYIEILENKGHMSLI